MAQEEHRSAFRALVHGMSWEGRTVVRKYRDGGKGVEEVLTAEVFQALQFLPRDPFIKQILEAVHSLDEEQPFSSHSEYKQADFLLSPAGRFALRPDESSHQQQMDVQFDAMIRTEESAIFVEAKRIGRSSFQPEQPARTYLIALRESAPLVPKVLFILGAPPPVAVAKHGKLDIETAVKQTLEEVYAKTQHLRFSLSEAVDRIRGTVGWITWQEISGAVTLANKGFSNADPFVVEAVNRTSRFVSESVKWHS